MTEAMKAFRKQIDEVIANGPYQDNWASLSHHPVPQWFMQDKLGVFLHFGVYSVPAFGNEWYPRNMYDPSTEEYKHHIETYGPLTEFGYKDFVPMFKAEKFSANEWVTLFREAGIRYVMPVAEHHDGFAMYQTEFNRWNAVEMGPHKDIVGELKRACEEQGLTFTASTHRAEHFFFLNMGRTIDSDVNDERYADFYGPACYRPELGGQELHTYSNIVDCKEASPTEEWCEDWMIRTLELVERYQPQILYFDWWIQNEVFKPYLKKIAAYYYNRAIEWGKEVTINYKFEAYAPKTATFDIERGGLEGICPTPWQTDTAIAKNSWGYTEGNDFKSAYQVITDLVDIVSKNGNLLINVGPKPDGTITAEETAVLRELGGWLQKNGEGIYASSYWKTFGEGAVNVIEGPFQDNDEKPFTAEDFRFTYKEGAVYAYQLRPEGDEVLIRSMARKGHHDYLVRRVTLLETGEELAFTRTADGLQIQVPQAPADGNPRCFKVQID